MRKIKYGDRVTIGDLGAGNQVGNELFKGKVGTVHRVIEKMNGDEYFVSCGELGTGAPASWFRADQLTLVRGGKNERNVSRRSNRPRGVLPQGKHKR